MALNRQFMDFCLCYKIKNKSLINTWFHQRKSNNHQKLYGTLQQQTFAATARLLCLRCHILPPRFAKQYLPVGTPRPPCSALLLRGAARPPPPPPPGAARPEGAVLGGSLIIIIVLPILINTGGVYRGPPLPASPRRPRGRRGPAGSRPGEPSRRAGKRAGRQGSRQEGRQAAPSPARRFPQPGGRRERRGEPAPLAPHHLLKPMLKTHSAVRPDTAFLPEKNHC